MSEGFSAASAERAGGIKLRRIKAQRSGRSIAWAGLVSVVLWMVPIGIVRNLNPGSIESRPLDSQVGTSGTLTIGRRLFDAFASATIEMQWTPPVEVVWRGPASVITKLWPADPVGINDLDPILSVNDEVVVAQISGTPLFRDIRRGDRGGDVAWLDEQLVRIGLAETSTLQDGRMTSRTSSLVTQLETAWGVKDPDGVFESYRALYLPAASGAVTGRIGDSLNEGEVVAVVPPALTEAKLVLSDLDNSWIDNFGSRALLLDLGTDEVRVASWLLGDSDLLSIAQSVDLGVTMIENVKVRLTDPIEVGSVPSMAVLQDPDDGALCVFKQLADGAIAPIQIDQPLIGREPGLILVQASLIGESILESPFLVQTGCGS